MLFVVGVGVGPCSSMYPSYKCDASVVARSRLVMLLLLLAFEEDGCMHISARGAEGYDIPCLLHTTYCVEL